MSPVLVPIAIAKNIDVRGPDREALYQPVEPSLPLSTLYFARNSVLMASAS